MSTSRRFCFTVNNYNEADELIFAGVPCVYIIYGREVAPTTMMPHLQGFVIFNTTKRFSALKKIHPTAHWEIAQGSSSQASEYCKKDGNFEERGKFPGSAGKRTDLEKFKDAVKEGVLDKKILREEFSEVVARYPRFVNDYIRDQIPPPIVACHPLYGWQQELYAKLVMPADDRKIIFIVDYKGNTGKTWFCQYYCQLHSNAQVLAPGKNADMAYALQDDLRVLFVNVTRQQQEHFQYSFFESLKDGIVFSPKYESCMRRFNKLHVVVMMNQYPKVEYLSADRLDITTLD